MSLASIDPRSRNTRLNRTVERIRQDFPILSRQVHGKRLAYLDTAASAQKPEQVIEAMNRFQREDYANIHRGVYALSQAATDRFEAARARVARFLNAASVLGIGPCVLCRCVQRSLH